MKHISPLTLAFLLSCIAVAMFFAGYIYKNTEVLQDPTICTKDKMCSYALEADKRLRDYQLDLYMDTVKVYDGGRLVGSYVSNWNSQMDTIIINDNQ